MDHVGKTVRRLREERGLNQAQLAVSVGTGPSAISQIENGRRNPNSETLMKLARALEVEVADLFPKGQAPLPLENGDTWRRGLNAGDAGESRHPTIHELLQKIQEMKLVEQRRRRDIDQWGSDELGVTRVWEWQAFDRYLRGEFGDLVDQVNAGTELESAEMQRRCLEFSGQLSTLENLSAQAWAVAGNVDAVFSVATEKTVHGFQERLQEDREVEQEVGG